MQLPSFLFTLVSFVVANAQHLATNTPKITDLELYQVNGVRKIFVAYEETSGAGGDIGGGGDPADPGGARMACGGACAGADGCPYR